MYNDIAVTRIVRTHGFNELQVNRVYNHVQSNNYIGCFLERCSSTPKPYDCLDWLVARLDSNGVDVSKPDDHFLSQELIYEEPENLLDCDGEVNCDYDSHRIDWFNQASGYD